VNPETGSSFNYNDREYVWQGIRYCHEVRTTQNPLISVFKQAQKKISEVSEVLSHPIPANPHFSNSPRENISPRPSAENSGFMGYHGIKPFVNKENAQSTTTQEQKTDQKLWNLTDFVLKILRVLTKKSPEPVSYEDLLEATKTQKNSMALFRMSDDVFESQFEDAINTMKNKGDIAESKPGRYIPL
jgi:hypothetical protein